MRQGHIGERNGRYMASYLNIEIDVTESMKRILEAQQASLQKEQNAVREEFTEQLQRYHHILAIVRGEFTGPVG